MNKLEGALGATITLALAATACTKKAEPTQAVLPPVSEPTPTLPLSPDLTATAAATTPTVTATPTIPNTPYLQPVLDPNFITGYLGYKDNLLVDESTGESKTNVGTFTTYFRNRLATANIGQYDRAFNQLSLPVKNFFDRSLNFDWRNGGQGLGFSEADFDVLRTWEEAEKINTADDFFNQKNATDHYRSWILSEAKDFEKAVLKIVDNWLRLNNHDPEAAEFQADRQSKFLEILGDLGVIAAEDNDGDWRSVNDTFAIACATYTQSAATRPQQPEVSRLLNFDPTQENTSTAKDDEEFSKLDSNDLVIVVAIVTPNGKDLRVEVYTVANRPDLYSNQNKDISAQSDASLDRWLPCGVGAPQPGVLEVPPPPGVTPPARKTPGPRNDEQFPPEPGTGDNPVEQIPEGTDIP